MPNTFLTVNEIAKRALPILQSNLVMPALINVDYSDTFTKKGDTIQVERPAVYVADEFGSTINLQNINPRPILVKMDKIADVSVEVTAKQLALDNVEFDRLVLQPAITAIAEKINADGLALYKYVPGYAGTAGTTPDGLDDFANASKVLNDNKVPMSNRKAVWNTSAQAKFTVLDAIVNAEKSGSNEALKEGSLGRIMGLDNFMSQAVKTHTAGGYTALADVKATCDVDNNATDATTGFEYSVFTMASTAGASTAKLEAGDIFTCNGKQHVVLAQTAAAVAGDIAAVKVYPALAADITAQDVTFPDVTARAHVANLAFHRDAFAFVTRPLEPTPGAESYTVKFGNLTLRVTMDYDINTKKTIMSIDTLYGYAPLYPELATQILG